MSQTVGTIQYLVEIDTKTMKGQLRAIDQQIDDTTKNGASKFGKFASSSSDAFNSISDSLGKVIKVAALAGTALAGGMFLAAKASFDQVSAVQQATVALNAYEKDTAKVNKTLSELVAYARSDMGVLFNRKDLFAAAQGLKIMGDSTELLTQHVKIMSRSVGLGLSTWDDLTQIIGRVGSTGRLAGEDFDNLTKAGFKLDDSLRNTDITFEQLFKHLDKGIPADAMAGQANTIVGLGVRLQTAFRGVGDAILGVDKDSGQFIKGGLGDKLVGLFGTLTTMLKNPELIGSLKNLGTAIGSFVEQALPKVIEGFNWILKNQALIGAAFAALVAGFIAAKIAAIAFGIAAAIATGGITLVIQLIAAAVVALVATLTYLQLRFDIFGKAVSLVKPVIDTLVAAFRAFWEFILPLREFIAAQLVMAFLNLKVALLSLWQQIEPFMPQIIFLTKVFLGLSLVITGVMLGALVLLIAVLARVISELSKVVAEGVKFLSWLSFLPARIIASIGNLGSTLYNAGVELIAGFVRGIMSKIDQVKKVLGNLTNNLPAWKGPELVDKKILFNAGSLVIGGFIAGLESQYGAVQDSLQGLTSDLGAGGTYGITPVVNGATMPSDLENVMASTNQQVTVVHKVDGLVVARSTSDMRDLFKEGIELVNQEYRAKGLQPIGGNG